MVARGLTAREIAGPRRPAPAALVIFGPHS